MDGLGIVALGLVLVGGVAYYRWLLRERPEDRSAIDFLAEQRGLRIISAKRARDILGYWLRGFDISNIACVYVVTVEDFQGARTDLHVALIPGLLMPGLDR